ncbi:MAG TPA: FAD-dependent oxidoreductase [bacterium]|nr:FAD-dependent oxidoreductase [bacterium]
MDNGLIDWIDPAAPPAAEVETEVLVVGGGACGLTAALAAAEAGASVLVLEKSRAPGGNSNLSQGMIPAAATRSQRAAGIEDSPEGMAEDILRKNGRQSDPARVLHLCRESGPLVDWLAASHGVVLDVVTDFLYPGFSRHRIHAPPSRKGTALVAGLRKALTRQGRAELATGARVEQLVASRADSAVWGARVQIAGQPPSLVRAGKVVLACNGFGANRELLRRYIPEMADALYMGHEGNTGEGIRWGMALGAATEHMGAYQAHGQVAHPHGVLLTWALIATGGCHVNLRGERFCNEYHGYSEHALDVLAQPEGLACAIFDQRIHDALEAFEDFRQCREVGAVRRGESPSALAEALRIPPTALEATLAAFNAAARGEAPDAFGRRDFGAPLTAPLYGVRVTGALFHTQGGLRVDSHARVLRPDGRPIAHLFAGGGVAAGISGDGCAGYLSGNGLLTATVLGRLAGLQAAHELGHG